MQSKTFMEPGLKAASKRMAAMTMLGCERDWLQEEVWALVVSCSIQLQSCGYNYKIWPIQTSGFQI